MKKRLFTVVTVLVVSVLAAFCMLGCNSGGSDSLRTYSPLKMKEKYVELERDSSSRTSYMFYSNGTGEYNYYYISYYGTVEGISYNISSYVIKFKYTYCDKDKEGVACFYDSIEYNNDDNQHSDKSDWYRIITVSENVLMTMNGTIYVREGYKDKELPNFTL
ncbi:MAG: hypothetical protein HFE35_04695 [Clostridia bacterium]|jgi:hypothetical protein|nr:hypothetical protein [Clostridia bacterium]